MTLPSVFTQIKTPFLQAATAVVLIFLPISSRPSSLPTTVHFEVVSLRPSKAEGFNRNLNITPDGYHVRGQSIGDTIAFAYYPVAPRYWQGNLFKQAPRGLDEKYDIDARIPEKDLRTWQSQGPDVPLLRAALREMLEERCGLRLHLENGHTVKVLELVVLKSKPKALKPFDPSEVIPSGARRFSPYPAKLVPGPSPNAFYNTSMQALAYFLTSFGQPVFDATGLAGTYDFQLARDPSTPETANDPELPARMHVEDIGLGLRTGSKEMPLMIVDHYEKPSPN